MGNQASTTAITTFLIRAKKLLSAGRYDFVPRRKNMLALAQHGRTIADVKNEILGLVVGDYYKGPKRDFDSNRPGDIWEFKKTIDGMQFYVKLKITQENGQDILKCLSFHEDDFNLGKEAASMRKYCEECGREVETKIITRKEVYDVCGESIEVEAQVLVCAECGEEFYCEELDSTTLIRAYDEYRRRHKLLLPEDIRKIREQYGLSQRSFAKLLNWGDKTICRYENGSIQDKAHNSLLLFLREPENMRTYLTENEVVLEEKQKAKLLKTVDRLEQDTEHRAGRRLLAYFFSSIPSEENGFKGFDYEKLCDMVLFFANKNSELLKTKLMKLLNYSDMLFYKENGTSMSGLKYAHLPYGPAPDHFDMLLGRMEADHICHIDVFYDGPYEKHQVVPECNLSESSFSDAELTVLNQIYEKFKDFGSAEISDYSHKEKGYIATEVGEIISYSYALDLQLD